MLELGGRTSVAVMTRGRIFSNAREIDGRLVYAVIDGRMTPAYPFRFDMESALIHSVGWNEIGAAVAHTFTKKPGRHFIKGGVTLKYLAGVADTYLRVQDFTGTAGFGSRGTYLTGTTGRLKMNTTNANFVDFHFNDFFKFNGSGFGGDIGVVYEFRQPQDYSAYTNNRFANKYKFKAGLAILDLGWISFNRSGNQNAQYTVNIPVDQQYTLARFRTRSVKDYKQFFDSSPQFTATEDNDDAYSVTLPSIIHVDADYRFRKDYYLSLSGQLDLNKSDGLNLFAYNSVTLTPRFENEKYTLAVPLSYSEVTDFNAGISFRYKTFFIGSGSLFTAIFGSKQADLHIGFRYGLLHRKTPRPDRDKDGIYDDADLCPLDFGLPKYRGCPVPDSDQDGIPDDEDSCATIPGPVKYHGCPIPDTDKDGIDDEKDQCPDTAGTAENNGCPEAVKAKEPEAVKEIDTIAVRFEHGSPRLRPLDEYDLLQQIGRMNIRYPEAQFYIDGYTDNTGTAAINNKLSRLRAEQVAILFRRAGLDSRRFTIRSFGMSNPKCGNDTESGKACNRRVEIIRQGE
jgi:outer membrane protein OmpA-like peptidoglycan-associated protein